MSFYSVREGHLPEAKSHPIPPLLDGKSFFVSLGLVFLETQIPTPFFAGTLPPTNMATDRGSLQKDINLPGTPTSP